MCMHAHVPRENVSWNVIFRQFETARNASKISIFLTDTGENFKLLMINNLLSLFSPSWGLALFNRNIGKINYPSYAVWSALTLIHRSSLNRSTSWYSVRINIRSTSFIMKLHTLTMSKDRNGKHHFNGAQKVGNRHGQRGILVCFYNKHFALI